MDFNKFMSAISLREDTLDDLTYLQKHLRLFIKFHQKLSSKLYVTPDDGNGVQLSPVRSRNFIVIRKLMDELENEMQDISQEQKMLTDIVKNSLNKYRRTKGEKFDLDTANGFITRALQNHYEKTYFKITPSNVKGRMCEEELKRKYNQVKGDVEAERSLMKKLTVRKVKDEDICAQPSKKQMKRESLLKPHFRKPASGQVQKRVPAKATAVVEAAVPKKSKPNTQTITHSRLNLLRALTKVKTEQVDNKEEVDKFYSEKRRATLAEVGGDGNKYLRSDEDCSDRSSSFDGIDTLVEMPKMRGRKRKSPNGVHSEESSDCDYMKNYPALPIEPPPKIEYNQEEFLVYFKLITPQVFESLKLRRSERKRRNCVKNEKNDFHYGNFDLNEAAYRVRLNNYNKKSILYSPLSKQRNGK